MSQVRRPLLLSRSTVVAALVVSFSLLAGISVLIAFSSRDVAVSDERAAEIDRTLDATARMLVSLDELEAAARVYTAKADPNFLPAYEKAREALAIDFTALRMRVEAEDRLTPLFQELQTCIIEKMQEMEGLVGRVKADGAAPAPSAVVRTRDTHLSADIRELAHALQRQEFAAVADESAEAAARARTLNSVSFVLIAATIVTALLAAWWLQRGRRDGENLITICAWTQRVRWQGRWVSFEDYLAKRFNVFCTHGICDEALARMHTELKDDPLPAELPSGFATAQRGSTK